MVSVAASLSEGFNCRNGELGEGEDEYIGAAQPYDAT